MAVAGCSKLFQPVGVVCSASMGRDFQPEMFSGCDGYVGADQLSLSALTRGIDGSIKHVFRELIDTGWYSYTLSGNNS